MTIQKSPTRDGWIVKIRLLSGARSAAFLTTDHPASSYGLHVLDQGGVALGTAEVMAVIDGPPEALIAARAAGYDVWQEEANG